MVGGWRVGGSFRKYYHFVAPSFKLELARFSAWLRIQDGAECGNICISPGTSMKCNHDIVKNPDIGIIKNVKVSVDLPVSVGNG